MVDSEPAISGHFAYLSRLTAGYMTFEVNYSVINGITIIVVAITQNSTNLGNLLMNSYK